MDRDCVCIWINKVVGGQGHFGVDLIIEDGSATGAKIPYYFNPKFGTPIDDAAFAHGLFLTNHDADGVYHGYAKGLRSAHLEFYPMSKDEHGRPLHMGVFTNVHSFGHQHANCWYSSHIGVVSLPHVNYQQGQENYGRISGPVRKNGQSTKDQVDTDFRQYAPAKCFSHDPTNPVVKWDLFGYQSTGNLAFPHPTTPVPTDEGWFDTGPVIPADYEVTIGHHVPGTNKIRKVVVKLGVHSPNETTTIDVGLPDFGMPSGVIVKHLHEIDCYMHPAGHPS